MLGEVTEDAAPLCNLAYELLSMRERSGLYFSLVGMNYREAIFSFTMKDIPGTKVADGLEK
jgi:hypothetical protein